MSDQARESDPFTPCARHNCGHRRRCHDSAGCGKWIEARIARTTDDAPYSMIFPKHEIVQAHTCPCAGFTEPTIGGPS